MNNDSRVSNIIRLHERQEFPFRENERVVSRATVHDGGTSFPAPLESSHGRTIRPRSLPEIRIVDVKRGFCFGIILGGFTYAISVVVVGIALMVFS